MENNGTNKTKRSETPPKRSVVKAVICMAAVLGGLVALTFTMRFTNAIPTVPLKIAAIYGIYIAMAALVFLACFIEKKRVRDLGFTKRKLHFQILIGAGIAVVLSFLVGALPILISGGSVSLIGAKPVGIPNIVYDIVTLLVFVGFYEELIFRGYIQTRINEWTKRPFIGVLVAAALFGLWHLINGDWIQVAATFVIGCIFGFCRACLKHCSLLSVIIAHGLYDALLVVIAVLLL